jgi:hypothetical protein
MRDSKYENIETKLKMPKALSISEPQINSASNTDLLMISKYLSSGTPANLSIIKYINAENELIKRNIKRKKAEICTSPCSGLELKNITTNDPSETRDITIKLKILSFIKKIF